MQTFNGTEYLKIDIASQFGLDKEDWDKRIDWTDSNEDKLEELVREAENPALFYAAVQAYRKTQRGEPTGHAISLDAASSGLQLLACLTGCEESASLCGVVSTGHREDAYTLIYQAMVNKIQDKAKITRAECKRAIMTSLYSSQAIPKQVFGTGELLLTFYQTMEQRAPGAWALNHLLTDLWQPHALSHDWVLPDNFHARIKVMDKVTKYIQFENVPVAIDLNINKGTKEGRSISPNIIHSIDGMVVREMHRRCTFNRDKIQELLEILTCSKERFGHGLGREQDTIVKRLWDLYRASGFLSARILDYLDIRNLGLVNHEEIKNLILTLPEKPFDIMSIHDCFRVHPNYGNNLRKQYNIILSDIAKSDLLSFIASQITGHYLPVIKRGDISSKILEADYTLC